MLTAELAATSREVAATPSRSAKVARLADCPRRFDTDEVAIGVGFLGGEARQGPGRRLPCRAEAPRTTLDPTGLRLPQAAIHLESADRVRHPSIRNHAKRLTPLSPALQSP